MGGEEFARNVLSRKSSMASPLGLTQKMFLKKARDITPIAIRARLTVVAEGCIARSFAHRYSNVE